MKRGLRVETRRECAVKCAQKRGSVSLPAEAPGTVIGWRDGRVIVQFDDQPQLLVVEAANLRALDGALQHIHD